MLKRLLALLRPKPSRPSANDRGHAESSPANRVPAPPAAISTDTQADRFIETGNHLEDNHALAEAMEQYQRALELAPGYWRVHVNIGNCHRARGDVQQALAAYRVAYEQNPTHSSVCYNLGLALLDTGQVDEAIDLLRAAINRTTDFVDAMVVLSDALERQGKTDEAILWLDKALRVAPEHPGILRNKAICLDHMGRLEEADAIVDQILARNANDSAAMSCKARLAKNQGDIGTSLDCLRGALARNESIQLLQEYLMTLMYAENLNPVAVLAEHRRIQTFFAPVDRPARPNKKTPRQIGFISPDFRAHSVAYFIEPLFAALDRSRFRVHAYSVGHSADRVTNRLRAKCDVWREVAGHGAEAIARLIRDDDIDILIDLAGHTGGNRLDVLALEPAPVIATWLGYLGTTGLDAVDYRIVDRFTDPPGMTESHHTEKLVRMRHSQWCYQPQDETPPVGPLPALDRGYITFGSFNHVAKLSDTILGLWAELLHCVEDSRLLVAAVPLGRARQRITALFAAKGVSESRLDFLPRADWHSYFRTFGRVDVALDSFPYAGGTTTCDALYMGAPVITLAGTHSVARSGASLLSNVGLGEWIANTPDEFFAIGKRAAGDIGLLAHLRQTLRDRFLQSPLADQTAFADDFAQVLDAIWQQ